MAPSDRHCTIQTLYRTTFWFAVKITMAVWGTNLESKYDLDSWNELPDCCGCHRSCVALCVWGLPTCAEFHSVSSLNLEPGSCTQLVLVITVFYCRNRDYYHTCYALSGLAVAQEDGAADIGSRKLVSSSDYPSLSWEFRILWYLSSLNRISP